jgi:hypothetical protein
MRLALALSTGALLFAPAAYAQNPATAGAPLKITTTSCPGGTQGAAYAGCTIQASGGTAPYTFSVDNSGNYPPLPEGMSLNANTGAITSAQIGGQGTYMPDIVVKDAASAQATQQISFAIGGSNAFLANIFPSSSIFHHRVDAASTGLPVDTSPAAPIYSAYLPATVKPFFGNTSGAPFPNGIPAFEVPWNQPDVAVSTTQYQWYFTSGPIPANAPVEGTSASSGDRHVLIYLEAGGGNPPALYEMWQGIYEGGPWTDSSNALWPDVTSNALTTQGDGTSDAAGLPVAPLLANADEVIGSGTPAAPNGTVQHPIRFTLNHMLNYWVWPATQTAGTGYCDNGSGKSIPVESMISQATPPSSCTMTGPAGEIYRLKASVATPSCAATSPQAAIIITGFRNYGIILADNGMSGGLIGTPDARWNDNDLQCLTSLILSDFEPVNVSSLMVNSDSGATPTNVQSQTITFTNPGAQTVGTQMTLVAIATSGLAVTFASQTTGVCTVSGTTATFATTGTCTIQATQGGNASYSAAAPVTQSFSVTANNRSFVSAQGSDSNNCSAAAPCLTFAAALGRTSSSGEIVVVDSGDYGPATITQPVIISAVGITASITATSGNALTINTTGNVTIRGLGMHGLGTGNDGILVQQVGVLRLYNVTVESFANDGVEFDAAGRLSVDNSRFTDNQYGVAMLNASAQGYMHRTSLDHNSAAGVYAPSGVVAAADSSAHFNGAGFQSSGATIVVAGSQSVANGVGMSASGASSKMQFSYCSVAQNSLYAYAAASGGAVSGSGPGTSSITGPANGTLASPASLQ